jgi:hypothetical protein
VRSTFTVAPLCWIASMARARHEGLAHGKTAQDVRQAAHLACYDKVGIRGGRQEIGPRTYEVNPATLCPPGQVLCASCPVTGGGTACRPICG